MGVARIAMGKTAGGKTFNLLRNNNHYYLDTSTKPLGAYKSFEPQAWTPIRGGAHLFKNLYNNTIEPYFRYCSSV